MPEANISSLVYPKDNRCSSNETFPVAYPIPNLLILDEPVSGVDINGTRDFYEILSKLKNQYDMSIILVSHDLELVKKYADKVILLDKCVKKQGTAKEVFDSKEFKESFGIRSMSKERLFFKVVAYRFYKTDFNWRKGKLKWN